MAETQCIQIRVNERNVRESKRKKDILQSAVSVMKQNVPVGLLRWATLS
jgi:hypothetical protein